jgi:hypothetical protein
MVRDERDARFVLLATHLGLKLLIKLEKGKAKQFLRVININTSAKASHINASAHHTSIITSSHFTLE